MGCGKSSIGRRVAKSSGYRFADTDRMAEKDAGKTIASIFAGDGEEAFRKLETKAIESIPAHGINMVVATGGGAPCHGSNLSLMNERGITIYMKTCEGTLFDNLWQGRGKRPKIASLNDGELREYIRKTLPEREIYYSRATVTIECDGKSDKQITTEILNCIDTQVNIP